MEISSVEDRPRYIGVFKASDKPITALNYVLGDVSVAVGDAGGRLTWAQVENGEGRRVFREIHSFESSGYAIVDLESSLRDKQFLSVDAKGNIALHHMTSEQTFFKVGGEALT